MTKQEAQALFLKFLELECIKEKIDPKRPVVAFATYRDKKEVIAIGHNKVMNRNLPFRSYETGETHKYVIHAEEDLLNDLTLFSKYNPKNGGKIDVYVTYAPCEHCAALLSNFYNVASVYYLDVLNENNRGIELLNNFSSIKCRQLV